MKKIFMYLSMLLCLALTFCGCDADVITTEEATAIIQELDEEISEPDIESEAPEEESPIIIEDKAEPPIDEDGSYTSCEDVALYIHTYGKLPKNFITKQEAEDLGWDSRKGNLDEVAPGMSIGGNKFGNYEQLLPDGKYKECDINYSGGYRGDERIVYSEDGDIYYTDDHYATFTQLY